MGTRRIIALWLLAILVAIGSGFASQWQYERHLARSTFSNEVSNQLASPTMPWTPNTLKLPIWQKISLNGTLSNDAKLLRNRPLDGRNGFWVITTINETSGAKIPALIGWIPSGSSATAVVAPPKFENTNYEIIGIVRTFESKQIASDLPSGQLISFDKSAVPGGTDFFIQILEIEPPFNLTGIRAVPIPNISQGPHFFYAIQWLVFAAIAIFGAAWLTKTELNVKAKRS